MLVKAVFAHRTPIATVLLGFAALVSSPVIAQDSPEAAPEAVRPAQGPVTSPESQAETKDKRVFGVLPNYRTADANSTYSPITPKQKFMIATKDTLDYPLFILGAGLAGVAQMTNEHPDFGQGFKGYAQRYATSYSDQFIGNYMTEGLLPILFHQDPRYFRIGPAQGGVWHRTGYALSRILVTKNDKGHNTFNVSEILGNSVSAGVGNAYYPGERHLSDNFERLGTYLATDALSQVLKEFWPDVKRKYFERHRHDSK
jgi:hypothetical protein